MSRKFNISGEINRHEVCRNIIWFKFFCHFVDPDLAFEIFRQKDGATEYWDVDFEIEGWGTCCTTVLGLRKFPCRASAFLLSFLVSKKNSFWSSLDPYFYASYGSESGKDTQVFVEVSRGCKLFYNLGKHMNSLGEWFAWGV